MRKGWMRASLASGVCGAAAVMLWAGAASAAPSIIARGDAATTSAGTPVTLHVLANDTISGGTVGIRVSSSPSHGSASVSGTAIVYSPTAGFNGTDDFTYEACFGASGPCAFASVHIAVGSQTATTPYGGGDVGTQGTSSTGAGTTSSQSTGSGGALPFTGTSDALLGLLAAACLGGGYACYRAGRDRARSAVR